MTIFARNPVHSVLWLIVAFFNAAGLMVLVGAEFIAMLLVIVYVGAVAVLFLFVVMMLDIDFAELRAGFVSNLPARDAAGDRAAGEILLGLGAYGRRGGAAGHCDGSAARRRCAQYRGDRRIALHQAICSCSKRRALILLVAMIGAIVLTHRSAGRARRIFRPEPPPSGDACAM
jgi:NADH-quinone oxidoreductase subunit J